jgi:hypothetical protein
MPHSVVIDVGTHERDVFEELLVGHIFNGRPRNDRAELKDRRTVGCEGLRRLVFCDLGDVLSYAVREQTFGWGVFSFSNRQRDRNGYQLSIAKCDPLQRMGLPIKGDDGKRWYRTMKLTGVKMTDRRQWVVLSAASRNLIARQAVEEIALRQSKGPAACS